MQVCDQQRVLLANERRVTKHNSNAQMDLSWMFECESSAECACRGAAVFECDEMHTVYENVSLAEMVR